MPFEAADRGAKSSSSPPKGRTPSLPPKFAPVARKLRTKVQRSEGMDVIHILEELQYRDTDPFVRWFEYPRRLHRPGQMPGLSSRSRRGFCEAHYCKEMSSNLGDKSTPDLCTLQLRDNMNWIDFLPQGAVNWIQGGIGAEQSAVVDRNWQGHFQFFQLWINSPAAKKMDVPKFEVASQNAIPPVWVSDDPQVTAKPLVGEVLPPSSPIWELPETRSFSGDEHLDIPYSAEYNLTEFTIDLLVRRMRVGASQSSPLSSRDCNPHSGYALYVTQSGHWEFVVGTGAAWSVVSGKSSFEIGEWVRLTASYSSKAHEQKFYINGEPQGVRHTKFRANSRRPLRLGGGATERFPPWYFFTGDVKDARIYEGALVPAQLSGITSTIVNMHVDMQYVDFEADAGGLVTHPLPTELIRRFIYVYRGGGVFGSANPGTASNIPVPAQAGDLLTLGAGSNVRALAGNGGLGFLLLAGKPIGEPAVQHPQQAFMMNTQEEIRQACTDFHLGALCALPAVHERHDEPPVCRGSLKGLNVSS